MLELFALLKKKNNIFKIPEKLNGLSISVFYQSLFIPVILYRVIIVRYFQCQLSNAVNFYNTNHECGLIIITAGETRGQNVSKKKGATKNLVQKNTFACTAMIVVFL